MALVHSAIADLAVSTTIQNGARYRCAARTEAGPTHGMLHAWLGQNVLECDELKPLPRAGEWHIAPKHVTRSPWPRAAAGAGLRARGVEFRTVGSDITVKRL